MSTRLRRRCALAVLWLNALAVVPAHADWYETLAASVSGSQTAINFRLRNEIADPDSFRNNARATTLRTRLTWTSAALGRWVYGAEADYVLVIGAERYNSLANGLTQYPVIADPKGLDLNQIYVRYSGEHLKTTLGRQRVNHGRQRFIGGVAWRQNEQTLEGIQLKFGQANRIEYTWVSRVNRIFGPDDSVQPRTWDSNSHLLRSSWNLAKRHELQGFAYLMDFENGNGVLNSNATIGLEYNGTMGPVRLAAAWARQTEHGDNPVDYEAAYYLLEARYAAKRLGATLGFEVLGSDGGASGFRTPLATLHKFQGWADMFLGTPAAGVEDLYAGFNGNAGKLALAVVWHTFSANEGSADYGRETNFVATYPLHKALKLQIKFAAYRADGFGVDTNKIWATLNLKF